MPTQPEPDETNKPLLAPQLESAAGGGSGRPVKTALGMFDSNHNFDPKLISEKPPFWFRHRRSRVYKHFQKCFKDMSNERAFELLERCGFPPLCILTVATRWNLLNDREFDVLDLQAVYETAGYDVSNFGKILNEVENRCLYRLDKMFGLKSARMLECAELEEFVR